MFGEGRRGGATASASDVGEAIVTYLRDGRPRTESRFVFLRLLGPTGPLTSCGVWNIVARASKRAGQGRVGPHRLRHALAVDMLARGAALPEIGQVLRHRDLATTAVYAKVDLVALNGVARPWPGAAR